MPVLKQLFNFYINSSVHVAIAVVCLTWLTYLEFNIGLNERLLLFVFFASVSGYNFVKYFGLAKFYHRSLALWLKYIQGFSLICFFGTIYFSFSLNWNAVLIILGLGLLTFLYARPFFPNKFIKDNLKNLRAISGLKIYIIALVWSVTVIIFPIVNENHVIDNSVIISLVQRFIFVVVLMLPFEIRDLKNDSLKLLTIPQQIGVRRTKQIGVVLLLVLFALQFFRDDFKVSSLIVLSVICFSTFLFLIGSTVEQKKYFSAFWVESIPVFWWFLYLILIK